MVIIDDFLKLTQEQKDALIALFEKHPNQSFFEKGYTTNLLLKNSILKHYSSDTPRFGSNGPRVRYEVLDNDYLGHGHFSDTYKSICTLSIDADKKLHVKVRKPGSLRMIKFQDPLLTDGKNTQGIPCMEAINKRVENIINEWSLMHKAGYFHVKPCVEDDYGYYFVARFFPGKKLRDVFEMSLSVHEKYELSIAMLQAYQKQLETTGIVHCDAHPENILVNTNQNQFEVYFIDLGYGHLANTETNNNFAINFFNHALERYNPEKFHINGKFDIFSLGLNMALLFKIPLADFYVGKDLPKHMATDRQKLLDKMTARKWGIFNTTNNSQPINEELLILIKKMCSNQPADRPNAQQTIEELNRLMDIESKLQLNIK